MAGRRAGNTAMVRTAWGAAVGLSSFAVPSTPKQDPRTEPDPTYRELLGDSAWQRLKPEIRGRFSVKPKRGRRQHYVGVMQRIELSFLGWLFAQFCRLIGTPLAPHTGKDVPMGIRLERDESLGGVAWIRGYNFPGRARLDVRSTKFTSGPRELTEHIGCGFSMRMHLRERDGDLYFISHGYDVELFGHSLRIPHRLTPGKTIVSHEQIEGERFRFTLAVDHPWFGRTIWQEGEFRAACVLRRRVSVVREDAEREADRPIDHQEDRPRYDERHRIGQHHRRYRADAGLRDVALCEHDDQWEVRH